jgi:hypothetical protein
LWLKRWSYSAVYALEFKGREEQELAWQNSARKVGAACWWYLWSGGENLVKKESPVAQFEAWRATCGYHSGSTLLPRVMLNSDGDCHWRETGLTGGNGETDGGAQKQGTANRRRKTVRCSPTGQRRVWQSQRQSPTGRGQNRANLRSGR